MLSPPNMLLLFIIWILVSGSATYSSDDENNTINDVQEARSDSEESVVVHSNTPTLVYGTPTLVYGTNGGLNLDSGR